MLFSAHRFIILFPERRISEYIGNSQNYFLTSEGVSRGVLLDLRTKSTIMNSQKFIVGGVVGGIVNFILGWLVYGMLLKDFMASNASSGIMRADSDMIWWALIVGNLCVGFLLAYVIGKGGAASAAKGAAVGFVVGLLVSLGYDLIMYATSTVMTSLKGVAADVAGSALISAITGAVVGWVLGMSKKTVVAA